MTYVITVTQKEIDALFRVSEAFDGLGASKRGSPGDVFTRFVNRVDETVSQQTRPVGAVLRVQRIGMGGGCR